MSTADTSDFLVVSANRELKQRLGQAEQTIKLLQADLVNMTKVADGQYLREQESATKFKWVAMVVKHLQDGKPLPDSWRTMAIEGLIKHVFEYQIDEKRRKAKETSGENEQQIPSTRTTADSAGHDAGQQRPTDRPAAAAIAGGDAADHDGPGDAGHGSELQADDLQPDGRHGDGTLQGQPERVYR